MVLLFARPFRVGDRVRFRAGALAGQLEGTVTDISITYVRLETDRRPGLRAQLPGPRRVRGAAPAAGARS